jgi:UPF0755 protein
MDERKDKAKQIAHQMNQREKIYQKDVPTREQARDIVEKRKALEKQKQNTTSRVVYVSTDTKKKTSATKTSLNTKKPSTKKTSNPTKKKPPTTKKKPIPTHTKSVRKSHLDATKKKKGKSKKSFFTKRHIIMLISILLITLIISTIGITLLEMRQKRMITNTSDFKTITIEDGMNATEIATLLEDHDIIESQREFLGYIKSNEGDRKLLSGTYNFSSGSSNEEINNILTQKPLSPYSTITIYKGSVNQEIDDQLSRLQLIRSGEFLEALEQERIKRNLTFTEGWVFSDQYTVQKGDDVASSLASLVIDRLYDVLKVEIEGVEDLSYSLHDIIIIASMIQRETQDKEQMPDIAGVIYNRLEKNEPLGIDATTRYALNAWNRELEKKDFSLSKEYDTRRKVGLPPTGIGSVGIDAIRAALHPAKHDFFYYFHDKEGNLHLSYTYQEHLEKFNALK